MLSSLFLKSILSKSKCPKIRRWLAFVKRLIEYLKAFLAPNSKHFCSGLPKFARTPMSSEIPKNELSR